MTDNVQQIKEKLNIVDVISSYVRLQKTGVNYKALCPFHNEKTPSFYISPDRGSYYCFGCSAKGDIFTFVEEFEGLDFRGTLKLLAERTGIQLETYNKKEEGEKDGCDEGCTEGQLVGLTDGIADGCEDGPSVG